MDAATYQSHAPTVFVVDDDAEVRESLELLLLAEGIQVEAYESAEAFVKAEHRDRPGCLVLDVRLTGMNGLDLLENLAAQKSRLPVIVISASAVPCEKARALELGAVEFIRKPYDIQRLLATIQKALRRGWGSF